MTPTVDSDNQFITEYCRDAYDSNGNLTSRGECQAAANYSYDDENRLVSLVSGTTYRSDFSYDGRSRLRIRTEYFWSGSNWLVSATTRYVYDGNRVIQERNSGNTPTVAYTRGSDLSGSLEGAGGIGGLLARSDGYSGGNWTSHNYYFADGNGNVTYMINSSQAMVASYQYDPYGNTISSSGSLSAANVYRFSSKEIHVNSGMYYYLYRFYDPNLQRWINRDPIGEAPRATRLLLARGIGRDVALAVQGKGDVPFEAWPRLGPNLYRYNENDPVDVVDLYGLWTFGVGLTIGVQWGPINILLSVGVTGDTQGNFGGYFTRGGGAGLGAGFFAGVSVQGSNAKCNNDLSGPFGYGGLGGAFGGAGSLDGFWGNSNDGPVFGGGGTVGVGFGGGGAAGVTTTTIKPIW